MMTHDRRLWGPVQRGVVKLTMGYALLPVFFVFDVTE